MGPIDEGEAPLYRIMPANNVKRMTESKNHHSTTPKASTDLGKHSQMTINYLYNANVTPHR